MTQQETIKKLLRGSATVLVGGALAATATQCGGSSPISPDPDCKNRNPQKHPRDAGCEMQGAPAPEVSPPVPGTQRWALAYATPLASPHVHTTVVRADHVAASSPMARISR